jgi:hypothetical protein
MDWMGLEKNEKRFDLFGIQTHPIPLNPHGLRANRTSPKWEFKPCYWLYVYTHLTNGTQIFLCFIKTKTNH